MKDPWGNILQKPMGCHGNLDAHSLLPTSCMKTGFIFQESSSAGESNHYSLHLNQGTSKDFPRVGLWENDSNTSHSNIVTTGWPGRKFSWNITIPYNPRIPPALPRTRCVWENVIVNMWPFEFCIVFRIVLNTNSSKPLTSIKEMFLSLFY